MNNLDEFNIQEMEKFINDMYKISLQFDEELSHRTIYSELSRYNLKEPNVTEDRDFVDYHGYFSDLKNYFNKVYGNHIMAHEVADRPFLWFDSRPKLDFERSYIKFYVPLDINHVEEGGRRIMEYLVKIGVPHQSKIASCIRTDNVVVRFNQGNEDLIMPFIDYVKNDPYIRDGLMSTNPFVPTINGIGCMYENGESYNDDVSKAIRDTVYYAKINHKSQIKIEDFIPYYNSYVHHKYLKDKLKKETLDYRKKREESSNIVGINSKNEILLECIRETFKKYGIRQLIGGLKEIINNNNYNYISRGDSGIDMRSLLEEEVGREYIKKHIEIVLNAFYISHEDLSLEEKIKIYCSRILENELILNIDNICNATLEKYNEKHLVGAIERFITEKESTSFTRFSKNDLEEKNNLRLELLSYGPEALEMVIRNLLKYNGIDDSNLSIKECAELYVERLQLNNVIKR